jgi:hypothetical protein
LDIENYTQKINALLHRMLHGNVRNGAWKRKMFEDWNSRWAEWIRQNPNATPQQIINFANKLAQEFGLPPISF